MKTETLRQSIIKSVKPVINSLLRTRLSDLKHKVKEYPIVSFDMYDTLIKRYVKKPEDIFKIVGLDERVRNIVNDYVSVRKKAVSVAIEKKKTANININDIYDAIQKMTGINDNERDLLIKVEYEKELSFSYADQRMLEFFNQCVLDGKRIIIISEMYLPRTFLETLLKKCGFTNYDRLFVSYEENATKKDGSLYNTVLNKLNISPQNMIHIGNSINQDYISARKQGINSVLINLGSLDKRYGLMKEQLGSCIIDNFVEQKVEKIEDSYFQFGYSNIGPILYGFSRWLKNSVTPEESILFLSREGKPFYSAYKSIFPTESEKCHYAYVSRDGIKSVTDKNGNAPILLTYLKSSGLSEKTVLVDVGWRGSMQQAISKVIGGGVST